MAVFNATPTIPFKAAVRKYWVRLAFLLLQPVGSVGLSYLAPGWAEWASLAWFGAAGAANLWVVALRDAPFKYWAVACVTWFVLTVPALVLSAGIQIGA